MMAENEVEEYNSLIWDDGLIAEATKLSKESNRSIDPQRSLYDFFAEKVESLFLNEAPSEAKRKRETLLLVASTWGAWVGSPVQRQSLRNLWLEEWIDGENLFVAGTYEGILGEVAKSARARAEIKLETEVVGIRSSEKSEGEMASKASVQTADEVQEFDEVVVTTPLGWLKRNQKVFQPTLPDRLSKAIGSIGYGTLDKVYVKFPSAFWDLPTSETNETLSEDPDSSTSKSNGVRPLQLGACFTHWLSPTYADASNPGRWDQEAMNLAAIPASHAHSTLLFYLHGDCSVHIAKIVANAHSESQRDADLLAFFKPYYSLLPNFDDAVSACQPTAVLATAWANDKYAGYGSYSNFQVGLENGAEDIEVMRHGLPERNVWLAGEHTAPIEFLATTTGAYLSGEAVAKRIVEKHELGAGTSE